MEGLGAFAFMFLPLAYIKIPLRQKEIVGICNNMYV
jgi:hypothetical protein